MQIIIGVFSLFFSIANIILYLFVVYLFVRFIKDKFNG